MKEVPFSDLIGKTLISIVNYDDETIMFVEQDGSAYKMFHDQDCCETVRVDDVCGDFADLLGDPILMAEEISDYEDLVAQSESDESYTWTFYRLSTIKGSVVIRWYGSSNGYYSESVSFVRV